MADITQTFSESWYRIANQRISLRPGIHVRRQNFRGQRWIILENPFSNQFFRMRPAAYEFVARLRADRTVEEVWRECMERFPEDAPGQEAVIQLLSQLYFSNLLQYDVAADSAKLFDRHEKNEKKKTRSQLLNIMFMRFPLLDPDLFLQRTLPVVGKLISPFGALLWLAVVGWALKVAVENWTGLMDQTQSVLAPSNLPLLYLGLVVVKTLHEFGHAYFCRKFGGEVHTMGVLLMIFTPTPYMDATSSWGFRSRGQRVLVGAAGMIVEVFVAALAVFVWANTSTGMTIHHLAYNIIFIASVSTVLFNLIPLLRFDGYYILSDLLDIPNLAQRSLQQLKYLIEKHAFGLRRAESPAFSRREAGWLAAFGVSSLIYRIFVFARILMFVADRFLLLGIIMAVVCAVAWVAVPAVKLCKYLGSAPALERRRTRAVGVTAGVFAGLVALLEFVPFPSHFRAPGVVEARTWTQVVNEMDGSMVEVKAAPGQRVKAGDALVRFENFELELALRAAHSQREVAEARLLQAMRADASALKPLRGQLESADRRIAQIHHDLESLTVRSRIDGIWVAPQVEDSIGRHLRRGTPLGLVIDPSSHEFVSAVYQEDVDNLFRQGLKGGEVRLAGQADTVVPASNFRKFPSEKRVLPSPALGWAGGGEVPVARRDQQGQQAAEPFFEVVCDLQEVEGAGLLHGRAGKIRFDLPPEPLMRRWARRFWQMVQTRYQI